MDFRYLLTSFDGRIGRKDFWIGIVMLIIASFVLIIALGLTFGFFLSTPVVSLIGSIIISYLAIALSIKRLHDRGKAANPWGYIFFGPGILMHVMQIFGIGFVTTSVGGLVNVEPTSGIVYLFSVVAGLIGLWAIVELGFLKGNDGTNKFGPDPLQK